MKVIAIMTTPASAKIKYKNGNVTATALRRGYIQVSPFFPKTHLYLTYEYDMYVIKGYNKHNKGVNKSFHILKDARAYLEINQ